MEDNEKKTTPQERYIKKYRKQFKIDCTTRTEQDIIDKLESMKNKAGYIKNLIRNDIREKRILIVPCGRAYEENRAPKAKDEFFLVEADYINGKLRDWKTKDCELNGISPFGDDGVDESAWENYLSKSKYNGKDGYKKMLEDVRATDPVTPEDIEKLNLPLPILIFFNFPLPASENEESPADDKIAVFSKGEWYEVDLSRKFGGYEPGDLKCTIFPFGGLSLPLKLEIAIRSNGDLIFRSWTFAESVNCINPYLHTDEKPVGECEYPFIPTQEQIDTVNGLFSGRIKFEGLELPTGSSLQRLCPINIEKEEQLFGKKIYLTR